MSDPFLKAHRVAERHYRLSGPSPISMRDQLLRGVTVVERLLHAGELEAGGTAIIAGAGLAGAAAAVEAARQGCKVLLVDSADKPFVTQRNATSRFIDPTQYDWPLDHYRKRRLPWDHTHRALPFSMRAGTASELALGWTARLERWRRELNGRLAIEYGVALTTGTKPVVLGGETTRLVAVELGRFGVRHANVVIEATGFGAERCSFPAKGDPAYVGQPFWSADTFSRLPPGTRRVLISGGGDGALQDLIRVLTRKDHPAEVAEHANLSVDLLRRVQSAEERAHRGRIWAPPAGPDGAPPFDAPFLKELDRLHDAAAAEAFDDELVREGLADLLGPDPTPLTLVHPEPYLTCYYGLNRFLAHLLMKSLAVGGRHTWARGCIVSGVAPHPDEPHGCIEVHGTTVRATGSYNADGFLTKPLCLGKLHRVAFASVTAGGFAPPAGDYDVLILRHGTPPPEGPALAQPRQMTPLHLPG